MGAMQQILLGTSAAAVVGQQAYTTAGTYTWVAPAGVTKVSVVSIGGGGGGGHYVDGSEIGGTGGAGGRLVYTNNYTVIPANSYTVIAGVSGTRGFNCTPEPTAGGNSSFNATVLALGGSAGANSGSGVRGSTGGGGAGGYGSLPVAAATAGSTGGGGGGGNSSGCCAGGTGGGGGTGILGQGSSGAAGTTSAGVGSGGGGGSGGAAGQAGYSSYTGSGNGGAFGGGGGGWKFNPGLAGNGGVGAVRIIWPGCARSFPSTRTANE